VLSLFVKEQKLTFRVKKEVIYKSQAAKLPHSQPDPTPNTECSPRSTRGVLYEQTRCSSKPHRSDTRPIRAGHPRPIPAFFTIYGSTLTRRGFPLSSAPPAVIRQSSTSRAPSHGATTSRLSPTITGVCECILKLTVELQTGLV